MFWNFVLFFSLSMPFPWFLKWHGKGTDCDWESWAKDYAQSLQHDFFFFFLSSAKERGKWGNKSIKLEKRGIWFKWKVGRGGTIVQRSNEQGCDQGDGKVERKLWDFMFFLSTWSNSVLPKSQGVDRVKNMERSEV